MLAIWPPEQMRLAYVPFSRTVARSHLSELQGKHLDTLYFYSRHMFAIVFMLNRSVSAKIKWLNYSCFGPQVADTLIPYCLLTIPRARRAPDFESSDYSCCAVCLYLAWLGLSKGLASISDIDRRSCKPRTKA